MVETDEEQLEVLKNWWEENGTSLVITVVVTVGAILGYRGWEANVQETGEAASAIYENLVTATDNLAVDDEAMRVTASSLGQKLKTDHDGSTYAVFAAMKLAKVAAGQNNLEGAIAELRWALDHVEEPHIETMIRVRLSRVYLANDDPTAAMTLLVNHKASIGQIASVEEAKGDIFHALGDIDQARQSYQKAIKNLGEQVEKPILELKLADLPLSSETEAADVIPVKAESGGMDPLEGVTEDDA